MMLLAGLACWATSTLTSRAQADPGLIAYEAFDYATGPLTGRNGGIGWSGSWSGASTNVVSSPGLAHAAWADALDAAGNAFMLNRLESSAQSFRSLSVPLGGTTGQVYVSFVAQVTNGTFAGVSCFSEATERFFMGQPYLQSQWGADLSPGSGPGIRTSGHSAALQSLLVYRLDFSMTDVRVRLYVNPPLGAEPPYPDLDAVRSGTFSFDRIRVAGGQSGGLMDELRIGRTYAAVVPHHPMHQAQPLFYQWWPKLSGTTTSLRGIAHSGSRYLAVGESHYALSTDGHNWAADGNPDFYDNGKTRPSSFHDVAYGSSWFVAVGAVYWGEAFALSDGGTWDRRTIDTVAAIPSVAYAQGTFICVRPEVAALTSPSTWDVRTWRDVYRYVGTQPHFLHDVTYDPELGCFVAVGECGQVLWSASGADGTWTPRVAPTECGSERFVAVAAGRRTWVALDDQGRVYVKHEGGDWRFASKPTSEVLNAVAFGDGLFVAVGARGAMAVSSDAFRWFPMRSGVTNRLNNIAHLAGHFFAVGDQGVILQSAPPQPPQPGLFTSSRWLPNGSMSLHYFAPTGTYQLQASTNLVHWTTAQDFVSTQPLTELTDTNAAALPHRFYRVASRP